VELGFLSSAEYAAKHPGNALFIEGLYANLLGRAADPAEVTGWVQALNAGAGRSAVVQGFLISAEWATDEVNALYFQALARQADPLGLSLFTPKLQAGAPLEVVVDNLFASTEYSLLPH
jgi:Domain of unknown function (DUF4214)